jgi:hypothetical protein
MKLEKRLMFIRVTFAALALTCLLITPIHAQRFSAGLVAGLNASQIDGDLLAGFDRLGLTGGIKATMGLSKRIDLNLEFLYSERGSQPDLFNPQYDPDIEIALRYAELPVYISIGDWWQEEDEYYKVTAYAGVSYARLMSARTFDYYNSAEEKVDLLVPYFNENDISWLLGATIRTSPRWGFAFRYTRGITPLLSPEKHNLNTNRLSSYFLTFRIEYYFQ